MKFYLFILFFLSLVSLANQGKGVGQLDKATLDEIGRISKMSTTRIGNSFKNKEYCFSACSNELNNCHYKNAPEKWDQFSGKCPPAEKSSEICLKKYREVLIKDPNINMKCSKEFGNCQSFCNKFR